MTNTSNDDIRGILAQIAQSQLTTQRQLEGTQQQLGNLVERQDISGQQIVQLSDIVNQLTNDISSVTGRNAVLNDIIPELRESQERQELLTTELKQNFEQHQRNFDLNAYSSFLRICFYTCIYYWRKCQPASQPYIYQIEKVFNLPIWRLLK